MVDFLQDVLDARFEKSLAMRPPMKRKSRSSDRADAKRRNLRAKAIAVAEQSVEDVRSEESDDRNDNDEQDEQDELYEPDEQNEADETSDNDLLSYGADSN